MVVLQRIIDEGSWGHGGCLEDGPLFDLFWKMPVAMYKAAAASVECGHNEILKAS